jgi:catechol O-methyltransferase
MLKPRNLPFTFRIIKEMILSKILKYPNPAFLVKDYIFETAIHENPKSVLDAMDNFAKNNRFLMNVGNEKGALLVEEIVKLGPEINVLELGSFCGYSSILMAMNMDQKSQITSFEINGKYAKIAREIIEFSGLSNKIVIKVGASGNLIPKLDKKFDLIFIDHWKDLYKKDLIMIEENNLIKQGSIIFADNVGPLFGNKDYLQYVRNNEKFVSRNIATSIEYSSAEDAVEISSYQG